jgi:hypothetical protein
MSSKASSVRKRKPAVAVDAVVSSDAQNRKESKARRVSTDALILLSNYVVVVPPKTTGHASIANAASASTAGQEMSMERIGALIQDLNHYNNAQVNAALDALYLNLGSDKKKCEKIVTVGGCHALVQLVKNCLEEAIENIAACDQVTVLNELVELKTLNKSLLVINNLMYTHSESRAGITAIGGVEAVVKVMKTFPKCLYLQSSASTALLNLTAGNIIGKSKAVELGGFELLLAAVNNHLDSADVCELACWNLVHIVRASKENTVLLISLGGATAVAKVRTKWLHNDNVQRQVRRLTKLIGEEMMAWSHEE